MPNLINLREAELVETPMEGATLFCLNPDGSINRVSAANVGGSGYTAMINLGDVASNPIVGTCDTMTFEEAAEAIETGKPINFIIRFNKSGNYGIIFPVTVSKVNSYIEITTMANALYWTADGFYDTKPGGGLNG